MKKFIFALLLMLPVLAIAQIPKKWYTTKIIYVFNPASEEPLINTVFCLCSITYDGSNIEINNCDDEDLFFTGQRDLNTRYDSDGLKYYIWKTFEPSSGSYYLMLFYVDSYTLTLRSDDGSLMIMYTNE
jgi:hypothetical protein